MPDAAFPMSRLIAAPATLSQSDARRIWLRAQRLDSAAPFGKGPKATLAAVEHLGYVQIDTIHVIERCHHHILWTRIPEYRRSHLRQAQTVDKSVFEYWTHALSYVPTRDIRYFIADMQRHQKTPISWFSSVKPEDVRKVMARIRDGGALSIRDIDDDELVEKDHAWASRKPSRRALQFAFFMGRLAVSERAGMLKTYELIERHFEWDARPRAATPRQTAEYLLDRALQSQGVVSLDSICHLDAKRKAIVRGIIDARVRRAALVPVRIEHAPKLEHWAMPEVMDRLATPGAGVAFEPRVHILSPFDPLVIQRKRLKLFFDYEHRFEAYVPKPKRVYGYFGLPVLVDDEIVAVIDCKAERDRHELVIQQWTWVGRGDARLHKARIEDALHAFERFQFGA